MKRPKKLTSDEIATAFSVGDWRQKYPPILNPKQAADLLDLAASTLSLYTQDGTFDGATGIIGKHRRYWRDGIIINLFAVSRDKSPTEKGKENEDHD